MNSSRRTFFAMLGLGICLGGGAGAEDGCAYAETKIVELGLDNTPAKFELGDLDGDGLPEVAVSLRTASCVAVLQNRGGRFVNGRRYWVGENPQGVEFGDLDGDGHLDIVVAVLGLTPEPDSVAVLYGDGTGGIRETRWFDAGMKPWDVEVVDLNLDGAPDVAVIAYAEDTLRVLSNDGHGGLNSTAHLDAWPGPRDVAVSDVNGDRIPDLFLAYPNAQWFGIWSPDGPDSFRLHRVITHANSYAIEVADLNGDGIPDIASRSWSDVRVFDGLPLQRANSIYLRYGGERSYDVQDGWGELAVGDIDADGDIDIVTSQPAADEITVLLNDSRGEFAPCPEPVVCGVPGMVKLRDLDGDSMPELIAIGGADGTLRVWRNTLHTR